MFASTALWLAIVPAIARPAPVRMTVDVAKPTPAIDPSVYGVRFATAEVLRDLNLPLSRSGGNSASTYNWGEYARGIGAEPKITVPVIGWAVRLGLDRARRAAFSVARLDVAAPASLPLPAGAIVDSLPRQSIALYVMVPDAR